MYFNNTPNIATTSLLIMSELFPACFSCNNNFNLSQISSGSDDEINIFETFEAETIKPGDSSNFFMSSISSRFFAHSF